MLCYLFDNPFLLHFCKSIKCLQFFYETVEIYILMNKYRVKGFYNETKHNIYMRRYCFNTLGIVDVKGLLVMNREVFVIFNYVNVL